MVPGYVHIEVEVAQSPKYPGRPCGDVVVCERTVGGTTLLCADGIGSGMHAHIAAQMCAGRMMGLLRRGFSLRKAFTSLVDTMQHRRDPSKPFAAFSLARVRPDGMATILNYDAPPPIYLSRHSAASLSPRTMELGGALICESTCHLESGEGLMLMSDGITQAGLGGGLAMGWQTEGVIRFVTDCIRQKTPFVEIPWQVHDHARELWKRGGDDCTAVLARCRHGEIVNLLTGPPARPEDDVRVVHDFLQQKGIKIVCGGSTAEIVARVMGVEVDIEQNPTSLVAPPRYEIPGIDLVTEGAVTLNQVYNLMDEDVGCLKEDSGVTELCALLNIADRVNFVVGGAKNHATDDISFRQRGILVRKQIVPLLADRLREIGKLVVVDRV